MIVVCILKVIIDGGGLNWEVKTNTEGKVLNENRIAYLVDFSQGVKDYKLAGSPSDYKSVVIDKDKCVIKNK